MRPAWEHKNQCMHYCTHQIHSTGHIRIDTSIAERMKHYWSHTMRNYAKLCGNLRRFRIIFHTASKKHTRQMRKSENFVHRVTKLPREALLNILWFQLGTKSNSSKDDWPVHKQSPKEFCPILSQQLGRLPPPSPYYLSFPGSSVACSSSRLSSSYFAAGHRKCANFSPESGPKLLNFSHALAMLYRLRHLDRT